MGDFLAFRRMVTPVIIQILFWLGIVACVITGLLTMVMGVGAVAGGGGSGSSAGAGIVGFLMGLAIIVGGSLFVRVYCEILILFFRMNETLTDIKNGIERQPQPMLQQGAPYGYPPQQ